RRGGPGPAASWPTCSTPPSTRGCGTRDGPTPAHGCRGAPRVTTAAAVPSVTAGPGPRAWRRFRRHRLAVTGAAVLALMALAAVLAPWRAPHYPNDLAQGPRGGVASAAPPRLPRPPRTCRLRPDLLL